MALDDAVVMAPSLEEAAVMLEADLKRKSTRRDMRYRSLPPADETMESTEEVPQPIDKPNEIQKDAVQQQPVGESEPKPIDEQQIVPTDKGQTTDSISQKNTAKDGKD